MNDALYKSRPGSPEPVRPGARKINDFIYLTEAFSNSFLITTEEGNILVNTGMSMEAPLIKKNFAQVSTAPLRYIIFTQGHVDHVGGAAFFREAGTEIVATAANAEHQAYDARLAPFRVSRSAFAFAEPLAATYQRIQAEFGAVPPQDAPTPTITFEDRYQIQLGGLDVELLAIPGAETNDSLVIWLPQHKICFTGNLFGCLFGHFPNLVTIRGDRYRDALTVAAAIQKVMDLGAELLLVGHHDPVAGGDLVRSELQRLHDATLYVHDETVKGMNEGRDVHTLMREIRLPPELEVGEGYGTVRWSVRAIWENYAGWFHHRSTTELYATPQDAVHRDLVELAGGTLALLQRAQQRLEAGESIEALHLLDIALSAEPENARALELAIAVHEQLLSESVNFWLSAWIGEQIKKLRQRLAA